MPVKKNDDKRIYKNRHYDSALMIQHAVGDKRVFPLLSSWKLVAFLRAVR